jgi:hypothetical protein
LHNADQRLEVPAEAATPQESADPEAIFGRVYDYGV